MLKDKINSIISVEKNESLPLLLLFIHSFFNGISLVFFETVANTLFLIKYDTSELPLVYILTSIASVMLGVLYTKFEEKFNVDKLLKITLIFLFSCVALFFILINIFNIDIAYMFIMVFKDILWIFAGIEFGILTGIMFNIRQGKRLFGILMTGEILAGIVGGLSISSLMNFMSTIDLLLISMLSLLISFGFLSKIIKEFSSKFENIELDDEEESNTSYKTLLKNRYYLIFFAISVIAFFLFYFIDYIFYFKVEERFSDEKELAAFFGVFIAALNIVNLFSSLFVSSKALSRYGLMFGILSIPVMAAIGTSSYLMMLGVSVGVAFGILIVVKLLNEVLDISILTPSFRIIYQSIPSNTKNKVLAFRETIIEPSAMGIAGLLLLVLSQNQGIDTICYIIIILSAMWILMSKALKDEYLKSLKKLLEKRESISDADTLLNIDINILIHSIQSNNDIEVIYALEALKKTEYESIDEILKKLIGHKSDIVRRNVIEQIGQMKLISLIPDIKKRLLIEDDTKVLVKIIENYSKIDEVEAINDIKEFIYSDDKYIKKHTVISLIKYCGIDGIMIASKVINELLEDENEDNTIEILQIINGAGIAGFYTFLEHSLSSDSTKIKQEAIKTIGNLKIIKYVPILIKNLDTLEFKSSSYNALIKYNDNILDELLNEFKSTNSYDKKISLIKLISKIKTEVSTKFLLNLIQKNSFSSNAIDALYNAKFSTNKRNIVSRFIDVTIQQILNDLIILKNFDKEKYPNSYKVINEGKKQKIDTIFKLLSFIYQKSIINQAKVNYSSDSSDFKALSVELLDNFLSVDHKKSVITILENISDENKIIYYKNLNKFNILQYDEYKYFKDIISDTDSDLILKLSLIYELGLNNDNFFLQEIILLDERTTNDYISEITKWYIKKVK
jgi:hypothetical protein